MGFLERCGGGLDGKERESKKRKEERKGRAGGGAAEQALLEKPKYGNYGFLCFPSLLLLILSIICCWLGVDNHRTHTSCC